MERGHVEGVRFSVFGRRIVMLAVVLVVLTLLVEEVSGSFGATSGDATQDLAARNLAWTLTAAVLALGCKARIWRVAPGPAERTGPNVWQVLLTISAVGVSLDVLVDYLVSFLLCRSGLGSWFAWAGFLAMWSALVSAVGGLMFANKGRVER